MNSACHSVFQWRWRASKRLVTNQAIAFQSIAWESKRLLRVSDQVIACYALSPSDCYFLGKRLVVGRDKFSGFSGVSTCVSLLTYIYMLLDLPLSVLQNSSSLSLCCCERRGRRSRGEGRGREGKKEGEDQGSSSYLSSFSLSIYIDLHTSVSPYSLGICFIVF